MKQRTIGVSRIVVVDTKTGREQEVGKVTYGIKEMTDAFIEAMEEFKEHTKRLSVVLQACVIIYKRPMRLRTGVAPKIHNRTRKKQRLTRLQRRAKRQKR